MRSWLAPIVLATTVLWVWWVRRQLRSRYLQALVEAARNSVARARTFTLAWQSAVALTGVALVVLAMVAQVQWDLPVVRIVLLLIVLAVIVPLGTIASGRDESRGKQRRVQLRQSVQQRLTTAGASPQVAATVVATSRPFAYFSFVLGVLAAVLMVWHEAR